MARLRQMKHEAWQAGASRKYHPREAATELTRNAELPGTSRGWHPDLRPLCFLAPRFFTPEEDALLGTAPDKEIAEKLGRDPSSVQTRRLKLGIPWINPNKRPWTPEEEKLLGTAPDEEIALRLDRAEHAIRSARSARRIPMFSGITGESHR